jgi:hypothetical protein
MTSMNDPEWEGDSREHARRIAYLIRHWQEQEPIDVCVCDPDKPGLIDGCHRLCAALYMGLDNIEANHCCEVENET